MTYEKLSRALRYYYKMQIITKVPGKRLTYKFLQHPAKIRKGQRGARPHSNRNARAVDAELVTTTEPAAPDSSTCLPVRTLSTSSTTSTVHLFLNDPRNDAEPHHVSDELPENHSPRSYYHENPQLPFLRSSDGIRMSIQDQESPLYQDTTFEESRMAKSAHRSISSSPRHHSELLQRHQLKLYETDKQSESDDQYIIHRSKYLPSTTSPHFHQNSRSSLDRDLKSAPNLSIIGADVYTNKIHLPVSPLKQRSPLVTHNNHLIPHHKLDQDFTQEADIISRAISPSTLSIPTAFRSIESHMRSATTVPSDNKHQIFHGKYHPYSYPMHYNHKPPMQPYAYEQLRSNHLPVHYNKGTLQHNHINIFPPDTDPRSQIVNDPYSIRHSVKHEEQDEPEDLSLKPCLKKESVNASTSDPDHSHGLGLIDTHRDSPRSNSSDSAYGSDQADFGKDISVENLHE
uniref:ETS domain-containing protein n=1 Tax=Arion vulgaris TaxID=1028688 RepID=A0A0B7AZM5_9EUPU